MEIMEYNDVTYNTTESRVNNLQSLNDEIIRDFLDTDMIVPCNDCDMYSQCEITGKECSAFRNWASNGNYELNMLQKHLRLPRN